MRLWTVHPKYLDARGLTALWREALLAQQVLRGKTRGYRAHPQLQRFRATPDPEAAIARYLRAVYAESMRRGYHFDVTKIGCQCETEEIEETIGQLQYEWQHLLQKLARRAPKLYILWEDVKLPEAHPLFRLVEGDAREWEKQYKM